MHESMITHTTGSDGPPSRLWAITCYFNPAGYRRRLENYRLFQSRLKAPLVTVEATDRDEFDLKPGDAQTLIQLRSRDVLWQKERLLNIALRHLPAECDRVAWLDCDVVFADDGWAEQAIEALERHELIQPFSQVYELHPQARLDEPETYRQTLKSRSLARVIAQGEAPEDLLRGSLRVKHACNPGTAWAGRRRVLEKVGFYDACIIGGGNRAMAGAMLGKQEDAAEFLRMNDPQIKHYRRWAGAFQSEIKHGLGYLDQTIYHLWHGKLEDRRYTQRHEDFQQYQFDPYSDIVIENDCWRWNTSKPQMHDYVRRYFQLRREDG